MIKRVIIRNKTGAELGLMLEPLTEREDIGAGKSLAIEGVFEDGDLVIDVGEENFISIWSPPGATFGNP